MSEADVRLLERSRAVIDSRLAEPDFSVEQLASQLGMSRSWLHRKLVELGGESPGKLIRRARLLRAAALLRATELSVSDIARAVGYCDPAHFTRAFKRDFHITPSEYREGPPEGESS